MASFSIHHITDANTALLDRVAEDVFDDEIDAARLAGYVADARHALFVAVEDGIVIGQARGMVHLQPDDPPDFYVDNLGVAPAAQRRGVARSMMDALIDWGRAQGCVSVWVGTEPDNAQANPFYAALGFKRTTMAYFEKELD